MACRTGRKHLEAPAKGGVLALSNATNLSNVQIAETFGCAESTVRRVKTRAQEAEKENIDPYSQEAHQHRPGKGRHLKIDIRTQRRLVRHATKNKTQRHKSWAIIAKELGVVASTTAINNAFYRAGYRRCHPKRKPPLNAEQKEKRYEFVQEWIPKLRGKEHMIVYVDDTAVRVGESRGQNCVTRRKDEEWHPDCIKPKYRGYSEMMFWGCYTKEMLGPYYIFEKESEDEKKLAKEALADRNSAYLVQEQLMCEHFFAEQQKKPPSRRLKRPPKPIGRMVKRNKGLKGGIDWYRYETFAASPRLIPFKHDVIARYGHCYLVQDGAGAHTAWQLRSLFDIEGLTVLPWPGNSPDLNQIEPAWYYLKQQVSKRRFVPTNKQATKEAYEQEWESFDRGKMAKYCGQIIEKMDRVLRAKGDNNFHG